MRKLILFSILLSCSFFIKAQESKWAITFTPAIVLNYDFKYLFQPGVEYRFNDRLSLLTEAGFVTSKDHYFTNYRFFRIKPELRYYGPESRHGLQNYIAFQLSYVYRKWENNKGGCFFEKKMYADSITGYDKATINSPVVTSSIQIGTPLSFGEHFGIDFFMGIGVRMIFTNYSNIENASKGDYIPPKCRLSPAPDPAYIVNGTVTRFHGSAGFRFFYRL